MHLSFGAVVRVLSGQGLCPFKDLGVVQVLELEIVIVVRFASCVSGSDCHGMPSFSLSASETQACAVGRPRQGTANCIRGLVCV
eukprot:351297-Chlamydomonas_euryale.AAC.9